ncbi:MAG: hypothetical protein ACLR06_13585 [Christensenellaceae bacterium]
MGVVARSADGEVFRFDLMNGEAKEYDSLPLGCEFEDFSVCLETGVRGIWRLWNFRKNSVKILFRRNFCFGQRACQGVAESGDAFRPQPFEAA